MQPGSMIRVHGRHALVLEVTSCASTAVPTLRIVFVDGPHYEAGIIPVRSSALRKQSPYELSPDERARVNLITGKHPSKNYLELPFHFHSQDWARPLDLRLHGLLSLSHMRGLTACFSEMYLRGLCKHLLILCPTYRRPLWREILNEFHQRIDGFARDSETEGPRIHLCSYQQYQQPNIQQKLAAVAEVDQRFLIAECHRNQDLPDARQKIVSGFQGEIAQYRIAAPAPSVQTLPFLLHNAEEKVRRGFNVFCWAFSALMEEASPAEAKISYQLMGRLSRWLGASPRWFGEAWMQVRRGLQEQQWAGNSEVNAAWAAANGAADVSAEEWKTCCLAGFRAMGAWLLPFAEKLAHEMESLDEALEFREIDGRIPALRRFLEKRTSLRPLVVVSTFPDLKDVMGQHVWPREPSPWPEKILEEGHWYVCSQQQLFACLPQDFDVIHWEAPDRVAHLWARNAHAAESWYLEPKGMVLGPVFEDYGAYANEGYAHQLDEILLPLDRDAPEPVELSSEIIELGISTQKFDPLVHWYLGGRRPLEVAREKQRPQPMSAQRLRESYALFVHLGDGQINRLLETIATLAGLKGERKVPNKSKDGALQPLQIWWHHQQVSVFYEKSPDSLVIPQIRRWLERQSQTQALLTDGYRFRWILVAQPLVEPQVWYLDAWFADGTMSRAFYDFAAMLQKALATGLLNEVDTNPWPLTRARKVIRKSAVSLLDAADEVIAPHWQAPPFTSPNIIHGVALALLEMSGLGTPFSQSELPKEWIALFQRVLQQVDHNTWKQIARPLMQLKDQMGLHLMTMVFDSLIHCRPHRATETLLFPHGHRGTGIPLSQLEALPDAELRNLLGRWKRNEHQKRDVAHARLDIPREPGQLDGLWSEHMGKELNEVLMGGQVHWYLTWDEEGWSRCLPATERANLKRSLKPLLWEDNGDPKSPEVILSQTLCDMNTGCGQRLAIALAFYTEALLDAIVFHARLKQTKKGQSVVLFKKTHPLKAKETLALKMESLVCQHCLHGLDTRPLAIDFTRLRLRATAPKRLLPHIHLGHGLIGCQTHHKDHYPLAAWEREAGDENHDDFVHHYHQSYARQDGKLGKRKRGDRWAGFIKNQREHVRGQMESWLEQIYDGGQKRFSFSGTHEKHQSISGADAWCAIWFWPMEGLAHCPVPLDTSASDEVLGQIESLKKRWRFFHWETSYPHIFGGKQLGFQVFIGAPPSLPNRPSLTEFMCHIDPLYRYLGKDGAKKSRQQVFADAGVERAWLVQCSEYKALQNWLAQRGDPFGDGLNGESLRLCRSVEKDSHLRKQWQQRRQTVGTKIVPPYPGTPPFKDRPYLLQAQQVTAKGGSLALLVHNSILDSRDATHLRQYLHEHHAWHSLIGTRDMGERIFVQGENGQKAEKLVVERHCQLGDWLGLNEVGGYLSHDRLLKINPESLAIPLGNQGLITLLAKLHQHYTTPTDPSWGAQLVPFSRGAKHLRTLQGYEETELGFWVKGEKKVPEGDEERHPNQVWCLNGSGFYELTAIEHVGYAPELDETHFQFGIRLPGPKQALSLAAPGSHTQTLIRFPIGSVGLVGCLESALAGMVLYTKWGKSPHLQRMLHEMPLPILSELHEGFFAACLDLFIQAPKYVHQRILLREKYPRWMDARNQTSLSRCRINAYLMHHAGLNEKDLGQWAALGQNRPVHEALMWLQKHGPQDFFHPEHGWQAGDSEGCSIPGITAEEDQVFLEQAAYLHQRYQSQNNALQSQTQETLPF